MNDPAVEAAQQTSELIAAGLIDLETPWPAMTACANQALKPIRETYKRWEKIFSGLSGEVPERVQALLEELSPLIFATEELET